MNEWMDGTFKLVACDLTALSHSIQALKKACDLRYADTLYSDIAAPRVFCLLALTVLDATQGLKVLKAERQR